MKTQAEIVLKAKEYAESIGSKDGTCMYDYAMGYTKCQEDMATILFNISKLINESEYTEYSRLTDIKDYIKSLNKQD